MNVSTRQIKALLTIIDWKSAGESALNGLIGTIEKGVEAESEYDARSRVAQTWSVAGFLVSLLLAVSETKTWGSTAACYVLIAGMIITHVRSYRARKALQRCREASYQVADDLAHQHPLPAAEEQ